MTKIKIYAATVIWVMSMLLLPTTVLAQATHTTINDQVPINQTAFVPCANGGAGETVELTGTLHTLIVVTTSDSGRITVKEHFQPQGVTGIGETTGDTYQATGVTQQTQTWDGNDDMPIEFTFVNNFRIIGHGPGNNFLVHETTHVTVNANGEVTAEHSTFTTECR
jgi:hypothetical protein